MFTFELQRATYYRKYLPFRQFKRADCLNFNKLVSRALPCKQFRCKEDRN